MDTLTEKRKAAVETKKEASLGGDTFLVFSSLSLPKHRKRRVRVQNFGRLHHSSPSVVASGPNLRFIALVVLLVRLFRATL